MTLGFKQDRSCGLLDGRCVCGGGGGAGGGIVMLGPIIHVDVPSTRSTDLNIVQFQLLHGNSFSDDSVS